MEVGLAVDGDVRDANYEKIRHPTSPGTRDTVLQDYFSKMLRFLPVSFFFSQYNNIIYIIYMYIYYINIKNHPIKIYYGIKYAFR